MTDEGALDVTPPDEYLDAEWLPADAIEPNDWNPNEIADEERQMLKRSLQNHGWTRPILVHADEHYIIDGEQRWDVAQEADIAEDEDLTPPDVPAGYVPVFGIRVEDDEARIATVQHNHARGFVDYNNLYEYLLDFEEEGLFDAVTDELNIDDRQLHRIIEQETVSEYAASINDSLSNPWEPAHIGEVEEGEATNASRTTAMRDAARESGGDIDIERVAAVVSSAEEEVVRAVLPEDVGSDALVAYVSHIDEAGLREDFHDHAGITPDPEVEHPDEMTEEAD